MNESNLSLWRRFVRIAKPYWLAPGKLTSWGLMAGLLTLMIAVNVLNVVINYVAGGYMSALQVKDAPSFYHYLWIYGGVFVVGTPVVVFYAWIRDKLAVHWRRWLTEYLLAKYFRNRAYYRINNDNEIDNPDERLAQDVYEFTRGSLSLLLAILGSAITLVSFLGILYSISTTLVIVVSVYALVGTVVTIWFGKRLIGLNFNQARLEADFRYSLIHVRNNTESIAFYRGEDRESKGIAARLLDAVRNFNVLIGWQRNLNMITTGYDYMVVIIPMLLIAPLYFSGDVELGVLSQATLAFGQVLTALSVIVTEFRNISSFSAYVHRLGSFDEALEAPSHKHGDPVIATAQGEEIELQHVTLSTPKYQRTLVTDVSAQVRPGQGMLIVGPSGSGKSSLLRALAGLWDSGSGQIVRPHSDKMFFLPQRPYMILGSLRDQLVYPGNGAGVSDEDLQAFLEEANLPKLASRVGGFATVLNWADVLSLGEQQRVAFARLLLNKPQYAILDEATSALDVKNEEHLYTLLKQSGTTFVSVGHRPSLVNYHQRVLELVGDGSWSTREGGPVVETKKQ